MWGWGAGGHFSILSVSLLSFTFSLTLLNFCLSSPLLYIVLMSLFSLSLGDDTK